MRLMPTLRPYAGTVLVLVVVSLGCGGQFYAPVGVESLDGRCGMISGVARREVDWATVVPLQVDGETETGLSFSGDTVGFHVLAEPGVRRVQAGVGEAVEVDVEPSDLEVSWHVRSSSPERVLIDGTILGDCAPEEAVVHSRVSSLLEKEEHHVVRGENQLELTELPAGEHEVVLTLFGPEWLVLHSERVTVSVGESR